MITRRRYALAPILSLLVLASACGAAGAPTPSPTPIAAAAAPATPAPTRSPTPRPTRSPTPRPTPTRAPTPAPTPTPSPAPTLTTRTTIELWAATAGQHRDDPGQFEYECPAGGLAYRIWGTDTYTDDSSVCTAAVHVGEITIAGGGTVTIEMRPGQDSYLGTLRNGIESQAYGAWGGTFVIVTD